jgi:hypothetical protein
VGLGCGLAAMLAMCDPLKASLFAVAPADTLALAGVCGQLAMAAFAVCYNQAQRVMRADPMVALRSP